MTNHWIDIKNADVILIMGSNAAENHPISFTWVEAAMDKGATLISVDPRFTRTSARADIFAPLRSGTDIAFLGGMIKYILDNNLYHDEYVRLHTNAPFLVDPDFGFQDGLFTGYDKGGRKYDKSTWKYQVDDKGIPKTDPSMQDPNSVFQLLKKHFSRYDVDLVSSITGTPKDLLLKIYKTYAATGAPDKVATIMYAMGWTQHTYGTQIIRTAAIIQLLLGNIGRAGGGVNALRGESNVQGSTDHCLLFHILPGYLKTPKAEDETLAKYLEHYTPKSSDPKSANWWQHYPKYMISLLKGWYGDNATAENDYGYDWLPKNVGNHSWLALFEAMYAGQVKGFFAWGQNPAVGGTNANMVRKALEKLDWMVAVNIWELETAQFWKRPGVKPADIKTEVFLLPAALSFEKEGSVTNSGRWGQWRWKAQEPLGQSKPDSWIINRLMLALQDLYNKEGGPNAEAITNLDWNYTATDNELDVHKVAREVNGFYTRDIVDEQGNVVHRKGELVKNFVALKDDGSTACLNWLYSGSYNESGNMMARRDNKDYHPAGIGLYTKWAWAWPVNRRIIYNRASCDDKGVPFDPKRFSVRWNPAAKGGKGAWEGDVPDGGWPPDAKYAFIMKPEGHARLFGFGRADGPFPEHYEPWESPVTNLLSKTQMDPAFKIWDSEMDTKGSPEEFPIVGTTYRLSEMWQSGAMTRSNPWLNEMQPGFFVEMSEELAREKGIADGDEVIVRSARGEVKGVAMVTKRFKPFKVNGKTIHQIGMPWHWGYAGLNKGNSANLLTPPVGDANTMIPETKAFICNVEKA
jgi:formate dehydrogenase major subunit